MTRPNHDLLRRSTYPARLVARWIGACALGLLSLTAHANDLADSWAFMAKSVGNKTTIGFGSDGTPLAGSTARAGLPTARGMGVAQTGSGVYLESMGKTRAPGGVDLPVAVRKKIPNDVLGRALFRGTARAALGGAIGLGWTLYEVWDQLGYVADANGNIGLPDPSVCTVAPCYGYYVAGNYGFTSSMRYPTREAVCDAVRVAAGASSYSVSGNVCYVPSGSCSKWCPVIQQVTVPPVTNPPINPVTEQQFLDAIASRSGWPSKASQAFADAIQYPEISIEVEDSLTDNPWADIMPKIGTNWDTGTTGPQTVGDPKVSQKNSTNSSGHPIVEQTVEETKATVQDGKIVYNTTTITNIYNETTNTTETTTEEKPAEDTEQCKDGNTTIGCAQFGNPPIDEIPTATRSISFVPESLFGGGTCPAWPTWEDSLGSHELDLDGFCDMASNVIRPLLLAMAALAAVFIVIPARTEA